MKNIKLFLLFIIISLCLIGCSNSKLTNDDYILTDDITTSKGIAIGSNSDDFIKAYENCSVTVLYADDDTNIATSIDIKEIDYSKKSHVALPMFFIDNKPIDVNDFNKKYNVKNDMNTWLENNADFLKKHILEYKCLVFSFENKIITNIQYSEKNFND